eukprot:1194352-Prorocentrum_minimum.AAC.6
MMRDRSRCNVITFARRRRCVEVLTPRACAFSSASTCRKSCWISLPDRASACRNHVHPGGFTAVEGGFTAVEGGLPFVGVSQRHRHRHHRRTDAAELDLSKPSPHWKIQFSHQFSHPSKRFRPRTSFIYFV